MSGRLLGLMRTRSLLPSALFVAASAVAQGVVNPSLLRAPEGQAASTWSTAAFEQVQASVVYVAVQVDGARGETVAHSASARLPPIRESLGAKLPAKPSSAKAATAPRRPPPSQQHAYGLDRAYAPGACALGRATAPTARVSLERRLPRG